MAASAKSHKRTLAPQQIVSFDHLVGADEQSCRQVDAKRFGCASANGQTTGIGYLITTALATLNATDMFAAITILSLVGVCLVYLLSAIERLLHWSSEFRSD